MENKKVRLKKIMAGFRGEIKYRTLLANRQEKLHANLKYRGFEIEKHINDPKFISLWDDLYIELIQGLKCCGTEYNKIFKLIKNKEICRLYDDLEETSVYNDTEKALWEKLTNLFYSQNRKIFKDSSDLGSGWFAWNTKAYNMVIEKYTPKEICNLERLAFIIIGKKDRLEGALADLSDVRDRAALPTAIRDFLNKLDSAIVLEKLMA